MMKKVANFITKYAKPIFIVLILITVFAGMQAQKLKIEDDIPNIFLKMTRILNFTAKLSISSAPPR